MMREMFAIGKNLSCSLGFPPSSCPTASDIAWMQGGDLTRGLRGVGSNQRYQRLVCCKVLLVV